MIFDFDAEQYEFRDVVRAVLSTHAPASSLRDIWDSPTDHVSSVWARLTELGLPAMLVPEDYGGVGGDPIDLALPLEVCGYFAVADPILETAAVAAPVLTQFATQEVKEEWLPRIGAGEAVFGLALKHGGLVSHARTADAVLAESPDGVLHLVPASAIESEPVESMDPTLRLSRCRVDFSRAIPLGSGTEATEYAGHLATIGTATLLVGLAQRMIDTTRRHLLEREQFGRVIGSFQVLKHRLADVAVATEAARGLAWYAAYAASILPEDRAEASHLAKGSANTAAHLAGAAALQLHGGIGFTWEHDLHLWLQRAKSLESRYGSVHDHRDALAELVFARQALDSSNTPPKT